MKKIIIILVILAILVAAGFYLWQKRDVYFFQGEIETEDSEESENGFFENLINLDEDDDSDNEEEDLNSSDEDDVTSFEEFEEDCKTECRNILDEEEQTYCLEICGLKGDDEVTGDCENQEEGLNRDVCFKNKAIQELDDSYCNKIEENALKESCKNRILEEIIDSQKQENLEE